MFKILGKIVIFAGAVLWVSGLTAGSEMRGYLTVKDNVLSRIPEFRILFKGKETISNSEGFFAIPLDNNERVHDFSMVICNRVQHHFDKKTNTLKDVSLIPGDAYRHFTFSQFGSSLTYRECKLAPLKTQLNENCIIVLIDPQYIQTIKPWDIELSRSVIKLPQLVLRLEVGKQHKKQLAQASAQSILLSLDAASFHEPVKEELKNIPNNPKVRVSLSR